MEPPIMTNHRDNAPRAKRQEGIETPVHDPPTTAAGHYLITLHTYNGVTLNAYV
jgi:hypothetical protein